MHSSWLFSGTSSGPRQSTDAASGDRSKKNSRTNFEINSFVRSLNLQGVHLPGGFPFKGVTNNNKKPELKDAKGCNSLNELLDVLNDSVDRVIECCPQDQSNTRIGSIRPGPEEGNLPGFADLNDLIHLVSSTAKEFHDINAENAAENNSPKSIFHNAAIPVNSPDMGMRTLLHPEYRARSDEEPVNVHVPESTIISKCNNSRTKSNTGLTNEHNHSAPVQKRRNPNGIDFEDTPTTDEFFTPPELVEIYSENQSADVKRANLSTESLETLRYFETPRCFLPEVIRLAKAAGFADGSSVTRDRHRSNWMPQARRINFDEELWPIGSGCNSGKPFSPYFTGTASRAFRLHATERNFITHAERSMNASRSSPIFSGAGEAPAEPLEIIVPTRDRDNSLKQLGKKEIAPGSSGDSIAPIGIVPMPIGAIKSSLEDNFVDVPSSKLKKSNLDLRSCAVEGKKGKPQAVDINDSPTILKEPENANESCREERVKRKACVKIVMKGHEKICKQSKNDDRKKNSSRPENEDICEDNFSSISDSPKTSGRQSSIPRFLQESGTVESDEEKMLGSVKGNDSVETQMEIYSKSSLHINQIGGKQGKAKSPLNKIIPENNKPHVCCKISTQPQEHPKTSSKRSASGETKKPADNSNKAGNPKNIQRKVQANDPTQPIKKILGKSKIQSSTSASSVSRQSKIAQLTPRIRPNTTETSNKCKEDTEAMSKSKFPVVRKNQSQDVIVEKPRGQSLARKSEAMVKSPRSKSKPRPGTPKKNGTSESEKSGYSDVKTTADDKTLNPLHSRYGNTRAARFTGSHKTTIPVLRSKTFVCQLRREPIVRHAASKEDSSVNLKSTSIRDSRNYSTSGPVKQLFQKPLKDRHAETKEENLDQDANVEETPFNSRINTDTEQSCSDLQLSSNSNLDKMCLMEFSSTDSLVAKKIVPKIQQMLVISSSCEENNKESHSREKYTCKQNQRCKVHNKHAQSLRMLKNILSNQGVSVEAVKENATEIRCKISSESTKKSNISNLGPKKLNDVSGTTKNNAGPMKTSKTLFEKLAVVNEALPDRTTSGNIVSCEQSMYSFADDASESVTSYVRSMRDAEEQCCLPSVSNTVSQWSIGTNKSCESRKFQEMTKQVSNVSTEIDGDFRSSIYINAAVSPKPSETEVNIKSFAVAETQARVKSMDKDSATEETLQPTPKCISVFTETRPISFVSKDVNTDLKGFENIDATSQIDPIANSTNTASGKDFSDIQCPTKEVNTERPELFLKSRGVCVRGPRKIDGTSQFDPPEKSKDAASGKDYVVKQNVEEYVNTDCQDYLFEDRSVDVLGPSTAEEACQVEPAPVNIVNVGVGKFTVDLKSSPQDILHSKVTSNIDTIETVVVKDVDVVQWQSSTTFNNSRINCGSSCSSNSSLVAWRPKYSRISSAEKIHVLGDRVPKEAIVALEMASERAQNLYKAIEIYRDKLVTKKVKEAILQSSKSIEKHQSAINRINNSQTGTQMKKTCNFRKNSKIKSLLEANLESLEIKSLLEANSENLHPEINSLPNQTEKNTEAEKRIPEEVTCLIDDLLTNVAQVIESESEYCVCEDIDKIYLEEEDLDNVQMEEMNPIELVEVHEERNIDEKKLRSRSETLELFLFSRNSLLTVIYGTVCSLVFWALQFSITCDSV